LEEKGMMNCKAIVIGGSAGSLDVLLTMLPQLQQPINFPIIIVVHRKQGMDSLLTDLLSSKTKIKVEEAVEKQPVLPNHIYIAPSDYHLLIEKDLTFSLDYSEKVNYSRPSIDVVFQSAVDVFNDEVCLILLSGSNADGVNGMITANSFGATVIVQDPATAQVDYMPAQALLKAKVNKVLKPEEMADYINQLSLNRI
jgi:two-component system chemotaxis response regulator CheB